MIIFDIILCFESCTFILPTLELNLTVIQFIIRPTEEIAIPLTLVVTHLSRQ